MNVKVKIAPLLRKYTNRQELFEVKGNSPMDCTNKLVTQFPGIRRWLYDEQGELRPQVWFFVNGERISAADYAQPLNDGDELSIFLAIGGG